jgi:NADPH:quinone reductase-like Zn-dependent oxidoreductase
MKAVRVHQFGGPEVIVLDDVPVPVPAPHEVLVGVKASGVGPWDALLRSGKYRPEPLPLTLGSDISGVVEAVGADVSAFKPGDEIFGVTNDRFTGGYAEHAVASSNMIAIKPRLLDFVQAASVPVIVVTAEKMLFEYANVGAGQTVLIHGGSGNVGAFAVQLAHRAGARVIATATAHDLEFVRSLGAAQVIDFRAERFEDVVNDVDVVIDTVGGDVQERSFPILKRDGILVSVVSQPDHKKANSYGVRTVYFIVSVTTEDLQPIAALFDGNALRTNIGVVLALTDARKAHEMLAGTVRHPRGKIVLAASAEPEKYATSASAAIASIVSRRPKMY